MARWPCDGENELASGTICAVLPMCEMWGWMLSAMHDHACGRVIVLTVGVQTQCVRRLVQQCMCFVVRGLTLELGLLQAIVAVGVVAADAAVQVDPDLVVGEGAGLGRNPDGILRVHVWSTLCWISWREPASRVVDVVLVLSQLEVDPMHVCDH